MEILALIALLLSLIVVFVVLYNRLITLRNGYKNAFAQIDVQLKRRHDLIPKLIDAVKGYMKHERETLDSVINARDTADIARQAAGSATPDAIAQLGKAEGQLDAVLGRLFALSEAYPDLKASANFAQYQEELTSTENRVAYARQHYNDSVLAYNNAVESIPSNLIAGPFGFRMAQMLDFSAQPEIQSMPDASFN